MRKQAIAVKGHNLTMTREKQTIAEQKNYAVRDVTAAKQVANIWIQQAQLENATEFGLPEVDDRYNIWRVPVLNALSKERIGEIVVDARTSLIQEQKTTSHAALEARLLHRNEPPMATQPNIVYAQSLTRNTIALGDSEHILRDLAAESVSLVFTSPPYYNARPEYADYISYEAYLLKLRKIIHNVHRVLSEGRFFVINIAPVLVRRTSRNEASRRIAVPFDVHRIFIEEGYDFIEDIIWEKPEGAGWATGRGRRFAADRTPLQYKTVPVTEYILVYRKHTDKLIDWNIHSHPEPKLVDASRIADGYERTNIWRITPAHDKKHPAVFPLELAERVIRYYSFQKDVVLDPFAGIGTVGAAAAKLDRRFVLIEKDANYVNIIRNSAKQWLGQNASHILTLNCPPIDTSGALL